MVDHCLFLVAHPREGSPPLHMTYAVAAEGKGSARAVLEKTLVNFIGTIESTRPLSQADTKLKLKDGECRSIWPTEDL
jgi:hypothetical protein